MQNVHFTPPALAPLFSVNVSTIKRWIDRGLLKSSVTAGGHRRVSREQLATFVRDYPREAKHSYTLKRLLHTPSPTTQWVTYFDALVQGHTEAASRFIDELFLTNTPLTVILEAVITRTLVEIGTRWAAGKLTIYDEHRMSFLIRSHLFRLESYLPVPPPHGRVAILACVAGEHHEIPLQLIGLILRQAGWTTHILGINNPSLEVVRAIDALQPNLVCLAKSYHEYSSLDYLNVIARHCQRKRIRLTYGGQGWSPLLRSRRWPAGSHISYLPNLTALARQVR